MPDPFARPLDTVEADLAAAQQRLAQATANLGHVTNIAGLAQRDIVRYTAERTAALRTIDGLLDERLTAVDHQLERLADELVDLS